MNPVYDFSAYDHAIMLGDQVRVDAFYEAIKNQVKQGMNVAEVGTGTGILSAYAASQTNGQVTAIEFDPYTAGLAQKMFETAGLKQVSVKQGESFKITVQPEPEVLITETIGALGPEENIVEICHDFKMRHPRLSAIIPARLRIYAEPIKSARILESEQIFYDYFSTASFGTFQYDAIRPELEMNWCSRIRYDSLHESKSAGSACELVNYILGETKESAFSAFVDLSSSPDADAVHLYFESDLDDKIKISTHFSKTETHWRHAFVSRPKGYSKLKISYSKEAISLIASWEK